MLYTSKVDSYYPERGCTHGPLGMCLGGKRKGRTIYCTIRSSSLLILNLSENVGNFDQITLIFLLLAMSCSSL